MRWYLDSAWYCGRHVGSSWFLVPMTIIMLLTKWDWLTQKGPWIQRLGVGFSLPLQLSPSVWVSILAAHLSYYWGMCDDYYYLIFFPNWLKILNLFLNWYYIHMVQKSKQYKSHTLSSLASACLLSTSPCPSSPQVTSSLTFLCIIHVSLHIRRAGSI